MKDIYLDYNSTTPVDAKVLNMMLPWFSEKFGNASSNSHRFGWEAAAAITLAREQTAELIGAEPSEIIFTSGATEAINLALRGVYEAYQNSGRHFIICSTEHKAVLDTAANLKFSGAEISILQVGRDGRINIDELKNLIRKDTVLAAVMMANNETGVIQDVERIAEICEEKNILFFSDLTQAAGKIAIKVHEQGISAGCISGHKIYGPKGIGALYISRKNPRVSITPQITGGGHENNLRSGTLNVPGIVGLGAAAELANAELWDYAMHTSKLRTRLEQGLENPGAAYINGSIKNRLPNTTNICFEGLKATAILCQLPDLAMSSGSACSSALEEPSHVLMAMGHTEQQAYSSIRISLGKNTTEEEINYTLERMQKTLKLLF